MLEGGKCHGLNKRLGRVLGHWVAGGRVQLVALNRVVRVSLIEKVTFGQRVRQTGCLMRRATITISSFHHFLEVLGENT